MRDEKYRCEKCNRMYGWWMIGFANHIHPFLDTQYFCRNCIDVENRIEVERIQNRQSQYKEVLIGKGI